ncbi:MAG: GntR family transcriptional regulator [Lentisphaeria bacterium]|nr:GntR family transcriptional regulator [Lentisphaeria bacterium]
MKMNKNMPKGKRIVSEIKKKIEDGTLQEGDRLTTVREMQKMFDTSLSVVQNALQTLVKDKYIENKGHSGYYVRKKAETEQAAAAAGEQNNPMPFIVIHHNDLVWRRNFDEYDEIRRKQIKLELEMSRKDPRFTFGIEQSAVLERYVEQEPGDIEYIQQLINEGRLEPSGAFSIQDLNLVSGEAILMCHLHGKKYYREVWGCDTPVASLTDAFGLCSQIPQILKLSGFQYLIPGRLNNRDQKALPFPADGVFRWIGLDGSPVYVTAREGRYTGHGIGREGGSIVNESNVSRVTRMLAEAQKDPSDYIMIYTTEEALILENLSEIIETLNRKAARKIAYQNAKTFFEAADKENVPQIYGEFNPTLTGCYTTRISVKLNNRKAENQLFEAELLDLYRKGKHKNFTPVWKQLYLVGFHDAICGCHTDHANVQVREKLDYILKETAPAKANLKSGKFSVFAMNQKQGIQLASAPVPPAGIPSQKDGNSYLFEFDGAFSVKTFQTAKKAPAAAKKCAAKFETDYYKADFTGGIARIENKNGKNVFGDDFGEIVLRPEYGTMWQEGYAGSKVVRRNDTAEKLVSCEEGPVFFKVVTEGYIKDGPAEDGNSGNHWPGFESLSFRKEYIFPKHTDHFKLKISVDFHGRNTKTMICFPTTVDCHTAHPVYQVPFGSMERKPYFEIPENETDTAQFLAHDSDYESAKGDWPALNWVDYSDMNGGLTVANIGTPSHQLKSGSILVALNRSGTRILDGNLMPEPGSFENGVREYEFAFQSHPTQDLANAEQLGQLLNHPPRVIAENVPEGNVLTFSRDNIAFSAIRKCDAGILVRVYETMGRYTAAAISGSMLDGRTLYAADADGTVREKENAADLNFKPYEIRTFVLK